MIFGERIQRLCPGVSNEQVTELREFLVEASERLEAEPALMASSLKTLEQKATDQGYAWDSVVMVLQQVAKASSAGDEPDQLIEAWQTCTASEGSITEFTAVLTDRFPEFHSTFVELVELAREEHRALSGVAGGTSSWRIDPSRTPSQKKQARVKDAWEAAGLLGIGAGASWVTNSAINEHKLGVVSRNITKQMYGGSRSFYANKDTLNLKDFSPDTSYILTGNKGGMTAIRLEQRFYINTTSLTFDSRWSAVKYQLAKMNPLYQLGRFYRFKKAGQTPGNDDGTAGDRMSQYTRSDLSQSFAESDRSQSFTESDRSQSFTEEDLDIHGRDPFEGMDINTRRMSEKIRRTYDDLEIDNVSSKGGESLSALSESDQTLPGRVSAGLWDNARSSVMSDLTGDMQYAEKNFARSVSADFSGIEDKELDAFDEI